jgi:hypothetical protein
MRSRPSFSYHVLVLEEAVGFLDLCRKRETSLRIYTTLAIQREDFVAVYSFDTQRSDTKLTDCKMRSEERVVIQSFKLFNCCY